MSISVTCPYRYDDFEVTSSLEFPGPVFEYELLGRAINDFGAVDYLWGHLKFRYQEKNRLQDDTEFIVNHKRFPPCTLQPGAARDRRFACSEHEAVARFGHKIVDLTAAGSATEPCTCDWCFERNR